MILTTATWNLPGGEVALGLGRTSPPGGARIPAMTWRHHAGNHLVSWGVSR